MKYPSLFSDNQNIKILLELNHRLSIMKGIIRLLEWDQEVCLPTEGTELRTKQIEILSQIVSVWWRKANEEKLIPEESDFKNATNLTPYDKALIKETKTTSRKILAVPEELLNKTAENIPQSLAAWKEAKEKSDFSLFSPYLQKIVDLARQKADY